MKRDKLLYFSIGAAVISAVLTVLWHLSPFDSDTVFSFPLTQISSGLSALAGLGSVGNGAAVAIWLCLSLAPAAAAFLIKCRPAERITLVSLSAVTMAAIYFSLNPEVLSPTVGGRGTVLTDLVVPSLNLLVWSLWVVYAVLVLIRVFRNEDRPALLRRLSSLTRAAFVAVSALAAYLLVSGIMDSFGAAISFADRSMKFCRTASDVVSSVLELAVTRRLLTLLEAARSDTQDGLPEAADRLKKICGISLAVSAGLAFCLNLAHVLLMRWLQDTRFSVVFPIYSTVMVAMILLICCLLVDNKTLRDESDLFI